jgi:membrane-associated phospholipid phosphatase
MAKTEITPIKSRSIQSKSERAKAHLKMIYARFQPLIGSILFIGLTSAIMSIVFFGWLAEEVLEGDTRLFDETIRNFAHGFAGEQLTSVMRFFTTLGSTLVLSLLLIIVLAVFLFRKWKRAAILFSITMFGAVILNFVLKISFGRARPVPFFDTPLPASYSFPSGHALFSLCFFAGLAWLISLRVKNIPARIFIWSAAVVISLLVGLSRIYLGVHFPSDVLAGFAAATLWLSSVITIDYIIQTRHGKRENQTVE